MQQLNNKRIRGLKKCTDNTIISMNMRMIMKKKKKNKVDLTSFNTRKEGVRDKGKNINDCEC